MKATQVLLSVSFFTIFTLSCADDKEKGDAGTLNSGTGASNGAFGPKQMAIKFGILGEECFVPRHEICDKERSVILQCSEAKSGYAWMEEYTCDDDEICIGEVEYENERSAECEAKDSFCKPSGETCEEVRCESWDYYGDGGCTDQWEKIGTKDVCEYNEEYDVYLFYLRGDSYGDVRCD